MNIFLVLVLFAVGLFGGGALFIYLDNKKIDKIVASYGPKYTARKYTEDDLEFLNKRFKMLGKKGEITMDDLINNITEDEVERRYYENNV